jgi:undecaprenyl diphosphate synthase
MADISIPRHVAIIMDGNGRWAKRRHLPRAAGHKAGVDAVRKTVRAAKAVGLEALTLYAFSSENWKRPEDEISDLMGLMKRFILSDIDEFAAEDVRLAIIGDYRRFKPDVVALIDDALARTAKNTATTLVVALNYGSQDEITRVARGLAIDAAAGTIDPASIDEAMIAARLDTAGLPPLDLVIRTSGEQRLSNFLLWQAAYAEMYFTDMLWPDFDGDALKAALDWFAARERRFGGR